MKSLNECLEERISLLESYEMAITASFIRSFIDKTAEEVEEAVGRIKNQIAKFELAKAYAEYLKANGLLKSTSKFYRYTR